MSADIREQDQRKLSIRRATDIIASARLIEFGLSHEACILLAELIADSLMMAYHEGAIAVIDTIQDKVS